MVQGRMKHIFTLSLVMMMMVNGFLLFVIDETEGKTEEKSVILEEDKYNSYWLIGNSMDDEVDFEFTVTDGSNADFYIMTSDERDKIIIITTL